MPVNSVGRNPVVNLSRFVNLGCSLPSCKGLGWCDSIITPIVGHNISPFVICQFKSSDFCVTVGNESCPGSMRSDLCAPTGSLLETSKENHAIISNFQYGCSGGSVAGSDGITIEITDEEGGDFCNFMINILPKQRDKEKPAINCDLLFQFGWIVSKCRDGGGRCNIASLVRKCFPLKVDIAFQGGGIVKFTIHAPNPTEVVAEGVNTEQEIQGSDEKQEQKCLKAAIEDMFKQKYSIKAKFLKPNGKGCGIGGGDIGGPSTGNASTKYKCHFLAPGPDKQGQYKEWNFFDPPSDCPGGKGPKCAWPPNSKDPVQASMNWLQDYMTEDKKGFVPGTSNKLDEEPTVIFWESPLPNCKGAANLLNIGTFIVNGGMCSPVLEFKPQVQWFMANVNQGGTVSGQTTGKPVATAGSRGNKDERTMVFPDISCDVTGQGNNYRLPTSQSRGNTTPDRETINSAMSHAANARALPPAEPVKAELVIQGLPELDDPMTLSSGVECGICVVNPFVISKKPGSRCGDWLVNPPVNKFLSNPHWLINGVSHQIKEGSFTTTLHVWLATPGVTLDSTAPLGGEGGPQLKKVK